jgi:hypothetical protein
MHDRILGKLFNVAENKQSKRQTNTGLTPPPDFDG